MVLCEDESHISSSQNQHDYLKGKFPNYLTATCVTIPNGDPSSNCSNSAPVMAGKLNMLKKKLGRGVNVLPPPSQQVVFMMGYIPTKSGELLAMFDTGCSNLCITDDVPHNHLEAIQSRMALSQCGVRGIQL